MNRIKSIPQWYKDTQFRSRLEARWARQLDEWKIPWQYEPEGFDLDGLWYVPDFWLPECRTFFEVKGIMDFVSRTKILSLWRKVREDRINIAIGQGNLSDLFVGLIRPTPGDIAFFAIPYPDNLKIENGKNITLATCRECGGKWFMAIDGGYECMCCGTWDGDHHIAFVEPTEIKGYTQELIAGGEVMRHAAG